MNHPALTVQTIKKAEKETVAAIVRGAETFRMLDKRRFFGLERVTAWTISPGWVRKCLRGILLGGLVQVARRLIGQVYRNFDQL